jgi:hypothetical protein
MIDDVSVAVQSGRRERYVASLRIEWRLASQQLREAERELDIARSADITNVARVQSAAMCVLEARMACDTIRAKLDAADRWYWELSRS